MNKIRTYQEFKKYTPKELFKYSDREDLTDEESDLFVQFCQRAINECPDNELIIEQNQTLEHCINGKNNTNE